MKCIRTVMGVALMLCGVGSAGRAATLAVDTPIKVRLLTELRSGQAKRGDKIGFEVTEAVLGSDGSVLVPKGAAVLGSVKKSRRAGIFGAPGKLDFTADYLQMGNQLQVPLKVAKSRHNGKDNSFAGSFATLLIGPLGFLISGKEARVPAGAEFIALVAEPTEVPQISTIPPSVLAAMYDPRRLSNIRFKDGSFLTGTVIELKNCIYTIATELGQLQVHESKVESLSEKPAGKVADKPAEEKPVEQKTPESQG